MNKLLSSIFINIDSCVGEIRGENNDFKLQYASHYERFDPDGVRVEVSQNRVFLPGKNGNHRLAVSTKRNGASLIFEGSPFAFFSGQNLYTGDDLKSIMSQVVDELFKSFRFQLSPEKKLKYLSGEVALQRVDLAGNFLLGSDRRCLNVLNQIRRQLEAKHGTTKTSGTSVYWTPKNGKEYSIGFYAKGPQMKRRQGKFQSETGRLLLKESEGVLRVEVRLQQATLRKMHLDFVKNWAPETPRKVFAKFMRHLGFLNLVSGPVTRKELLALPLRRLRPVYALHKCGVDLKDVYSRSTIQRHIADFRKLNIDLKCASLSEPQVIKLTKVLSPKRLLTRPPGWMAKAQLIHTPQVPNIP